MSHYSMGLFWERRTHKIVNKQIISRPSPHQISCLCTTRPLSFVSDVTILVASLAGGYVGCGSNQHLLRRRKQWMLALRPGHSYQRVAILQKRSFITRSHGLIVTRPGIRALSRTNHQSDLMSLELPVLRTQ